MLQIKEYHKLMLSINDLMLEISSGDIHDNIEWIFNLKSHPVLDIEENDKLQIDNIELFRFLKKYFITYQVFISDKVNEMSLETRIKMTKQMWQCCIHESPSKFFLTFSLCTKIDEEEIEVTFIGTFKKYPFDIFNIDIPEFQNKWNSLVDNLTYLNIPNDFKIPFISQLNLSNFLGTFNECIINDIEKYFDVISNLHLKSKEQIIFKFLNNTLEGKSEYLSALIIHDEKSKEIATVIFEMLVNNGHPNHTAHDIFCNMHWTIQKKFELSYQNILQKYKYDKLKSSSTALNFEQKIIFCRASSDSINKAKEKMTMLNSQDMGPKATQWLNGFFKIPFEIYHYNEIFFSSKKLLKSANKIMKKIDLCDTIYNDVRKERCETEYQLRNFIENIKSIHKDLVLDNLKTEPIYMDFLDISGSNIIEYNPILDISDTSGNNNNHKCPKSVSDFSMSSFSSSSMSSSVQSMSRVNRDVERSLINSNQRLNNKLKSDFNYSGNITSEIEIHRELENFLDNYDCHSVSKISYLNNIKSSLDSACYGHNEAKHQILRIVGQWMNGSMDGTVIGIQGPPGNGKTTLAKMGLSQCLKDSSGVPHPFAMLALGGSSNGSTLIGHNFTYVGSTWGKIVEILMEKKCMNPIIYIDEIDKVSRTEHGREIIGILTHLTDSTQNDNFEDRYFSGIKLDLSKVLFVMSFNDESLIDPILKDRMQIIRTHPLTIDDKIKISKQYLVPALEKKVGFPENSIAIDEDVIQYIIDTYTYEAGVRKLKEILFDIIREYNLQLLFDNQFSNNIFYITKNYVEELLKKLPKIVTKKGHDSPRIGLINGLYATSAGVGGLTTIETYRTYSSSKMELILTGNQGDIMKESTKVARTVAWNLIPDDLKEKITKGGDFSLHIHTPSAATPKDGPSAGTAITLAILSQLCELPIRCDISLTGEIDLNGNVTEIGGLFSKILGSYNAGVYNIFIPQDNEKDLDELVNEGKLEKYSDLNIKTVSHIQELLPIVFNNNNNIQFKNIL
tara:strand:- start:858 stop:3902 length:3045 start_codon:yes stop_codon:yes gene_type:complete